MLRDNPVSAKSEYDALLDERDPGLFVSLSFEPTSLSVYRPSERRPKVAILREQGVNGYAEMAYSFMAAGFEAIDVHMVVIYLLLLLLSFLFILLV